MRVPARVAKVVAMSDDVAIAIAIFLRDHLRYVAVCVLWRRVFGSLVVASLSRRVAIVVGYFRPRTRLLGGRGGSERPPRVRPPDRPIVYLTDRHCTRASLLHGNQPSQRGGCCGRVRQSHQPPRIARTCARSWCVGCPYHRAAGAVAARDCRARTGVHATLSSCRLTEAKSIIIIVTW